MLSQILLKDDIKYLSTAGGSVDGGGGIEAKTMISRRLPLLEILKGACC